MNPLEPYLPYIRYLLIAVIPAFLVYVVEQNAITELTLQLHTAQTALAAPPPPATHVVTAADGAVIVKLESIATQIGQNIDQYKPVGGNVNELVCLQGMRNSAASYLIQMIGQARQQVNMSINSKNTQDVQFADKLLLGTFSSTSQFIPNIKQTLRQMTLNCSGSRMVNYADTTLTHFIDAQLMPEFTALQGRIEKAHY